MKNLWFIFLIFLPEIIFSQNFSVKDYYHEMSEHNKNKYFLHTILDYEQTTFSDTSSGFFYWLTSKNLIEKKGNDFEVVVNPAVNFQFWTNNKNSGYINTRGARIYGNFSNRIFFSTELYENQGRFQDYLNDYAAEYSVLPGYSRMKPYKESDYDYSSAYGSIQVNISDNFNLRFGHDKLFAGAGHRSLIISDAAFQQLFFQSSFVSDKLIVRNIIAEWINPNFNNLMMWDNPQSLEGNYKRKTVSYNIIEYNISQNFRIGLTEAVIFKTSGNNSSFDLNMVNPLIIARSGIIGQNTKDNILLGINLKYYQKRFDIYSQLIIDDLRFTNLSPENPFNRYGWQLGGKLYNVAGIEKLHMQLEHNYLRPLTYACYEPEESYTHYNQNIAHPAGSNLAEFIWKMQYKWRSFPLRLQVNYMLRGDQKYSGTVSPGNFDFKGQFIAGEINEFIFADFEAGYIINPKWNWLIYGGFSYRKFEDENLWVTFGTRTTLRRLIRDF